jgi:hypothetical protein
MIHTKEFYFIQEQNPRSRFFGLEATQNRHLLAFSNTLEIISNLTPIKTIALGFYPRVHE